MKPFCPRIVPDIIIDTLKRVDYIWVFRPEFGCLGSIIHRWKQQKVGLVAIDDRSPQPRCRFVQPYINVVPVTFLLGGLNVIKSLDELINWWVRINFGLIYTVPPTQFAGLATGVWIICRHRFGKQDTMIDSWIRKVVFDTIDIMHIEVNPINGINGTVGSALYLFGEFFGILDLDYARIRSKDIVDQLLGRLLLR